MTADLPDLIQRCLAERQAVYTTRASHSPAGVALFHHAFAGDEAAWIEEREAMRTLLAEVEKCLDTDLKRLVAQTVFLYDTPPREVLADYPDRFPGDTQVAKLK